MLDMEIAVSDETPLPLALRRKLDGLCPRCGKQAREDADVCAACRVALNAIQRSFRLRRREASKCVDCGKRSKNRRCRSCTQALLTNRGRVISARSRVDQAPGPAPSGKVVAKVETDGKTRYRYVGRERPGAPSREQREAEDVRSLEFAQREQTKGIAALREANRIAPSLPRIQRDATRREALASISLAVRLNVEVLRRNKVEVFVEIDEDDPDA